MPYTAQIDGQVVSIINKVVVAEIPLDAFIASAQSGTMTLTPRLPPNTAFLIISPSHTTVITEREPRFEQITMVAKNGAPAADEWAYKWEGDFDVDGKIAHWRVPIPWEYFAITISNEPATMWSERTYIVTDQIMMWAKHKITDVDDIALFPPRLPNIYDTGRMCSGSVHTTETEPHAILAAMSNGYWESRFNDDLGYLAGPCETFTEWQGLDLNSINDWPWPQPASLRQLMITPDTRVDTLRAYGYDSISMINAGIRARDGWLTNAIAALTPDEARYLHDLTAVRMRDQLWGVPDPTTPTTTQTP